MSYKNQAKINLIKLIDGKLLYLYVIPNVWQYDMGFSMDSSLFVYITNSDLFICDI